MRRIYEWTLVDGGLGGALTRLMKEIKIKIDDIRSSLVVHCKNGVGINIQGAPITQKSKQTQTISVL